MRMLTLIVLLTSLDSVSAQRAGTGRILPVPLESPRTADAWEIDAQAGDAWPAEVAAHGPVIRVLAPTPVTLWRRGLMLRGPYTVAVTVQRSGEDPSSVQGLIAGGRGATALTCLVGANGLAALERGSGVTAAPVWLPAKAGPTTDVDIISVEVTDREATCRVNGEIVAQVPVTSGALDGPPGVYVAGEPVQISGFRVEQPLETGKDGR